MRGIDYRIAHTHNAVEAPNPALTNDVVDDDDLAEINAGHPNGLRTLDPPPKPPAKPPGRPPAPAGGGVAPGKQPPGNQPPGGPAPGGTGTIP